MLEMAAFQLIDADGLLAAIRFWAAASASKSFSSHNLSTNCPVFSTSAEISAALIMIATTLVKTSSPIGKASFSLNDYGDCQLRQLSNDQMIFIYTVLLSGIAHIVFIKVF